MSNIKVFENKKIRTQWNETEEDWYFSVVDVISILTDSSQPRKYWNDLKRKLKQEGSQLSEKIGQLKLQSSDGKFYSTDVVNTKDLLRLIQSIPSKKAEPFKIWLAQVGSERLDEIVDPQKAIDRAIATYREKGYSEEWITQRMMTIKMRKELTAEWQERGITQEKDYAILTNEMTKAWSGLSVQEYKKFKGLKKENLRDNMTNIELVLNMLAEVTTTELSQKEKPATFKENKEIAKRGGKFAGETRERYEKEMGRKIISPANANDKKLLDDKKNND
jgi:hypothetical protein